MTLLPDKLSDLIEVALEDLTKIEQDQKYVIDMTAWHEPVDGKCAVCLAGAVIANRLDVEPDQFVTPRDFPLEIDRKLCALDAVRHGWVERALTEFGKTGGPAPIHPVVRYGDDPDAFKRDLRSIQNILREAGL